MNFVAYVKNAIICKRNGRKTVTPERMAELQELGRKINKKLGY